MTIYMVFERLKSGQLSLDDKFVVSRKAWRMGGSKMFVEVNKQVRVEDLLRGMIVQSGNDACIVVAEGLSGSESAFVDAMNQRARDIGLADSRFVNATGWPDDACLMSPRELAVLARRIIEEFSEYYLYFAEKSFRYNKIKQGNRNPQLYGDNGADGLKTGYTREAGYGLVASAIRNRRRHGAGGRGLRRGLGRARLRARRDGEDGQRRGARRRRGRRRGDDGAHALERHGRGARRRHRDRHGVGPGRGAAGRTSAGGSVH